MAEILEILKYPDPVLRRRGETIDRFDAELAATVENMLTTMYSYQGVGLAAPQVGLPLNLMVLNPEGSADKTENELVMVNPRVKSRKALEYGDEGCLSFPGLYAEVERHSKIVVEYKDRTGAPQEARFEGFLARIVLHELDHLQGVLFVDRLSATERIRVRPSLSEMEDSFKGG